MAVAPFRVLTDSNVQSLLRTSDLTETSRFADLLTETLRTYSTTDEATYQPHRAASKRPSGQNTLFMPSTSPSNLGVKIVGIPPVGGASSQRTLEATMTLCDDTGKAVGVLNAGELTAFRTSLGAMLLFRRRRDVRHLVMFGAGKQAYWHVRLAGVLRGSEIETVTLVNRSRKRAEELLGAWRRDGVFGAGGSKVQVEVLVEGDDGYEEKLKGVVERASTVHCAVPSTTPLFPAGWLTGRDVYISAIGSYRLDMQEIDPEFIREIVSPEADGYRPEGRQTPVVVVDSRSGCFAEAGELVAAGIKGEQMLEYGELVGLMEKKDKDLEEWLAGGLVVYKSVGIGVMDLCVGTALFELAAQKGVGVTVENF